MAAGTSAWLLLAGGMGLSACVLVVPAPEGSVTTTCQLTTSEELTSCGPCVVASCQDDLDACCAAGSACEPAIHNLVACLSYEACEPDGSSAEERALRTCAAQACAAECNLDPVPVADAGSDAGAKGAKVCEEVGERCFCEAKADETASGTCKAFNLQDDWVCCASPGYPRVGTTCACTPVQCVDHEDGTCECGAYEVHGEGSEYGSSCVTTSGTCCKTDGRCDCDDSRDRCPSSTTEVRTCGVFDLTCTDSTEVSACAP